jgi:hypothetical protein
MFNQQYEIDIQTYDYYYLVLEKDSFGRDIKFVAGNGAITTNEYDHTGLLNFTKTGYDNSPTYIRDLEYKYDKNNNLTYKKLR